MKKLILIKLGGSVITDKTKEYSVREDTIKRLAEEIKIAKERAKAGLPNPEEAKSTVKTKKAP